MPDLKAAAEQFAAALTESVEGKTGEERDAAIAEAAALLPSPVAQFKFDEGHRSATGKKSEQLKALESEKEASEKRAERAEARVQEIEAKTPDAESIKAPYVKEIEDLNQKLKDKDASHAAEIAERDSRAFTDTLKAKLNVAASKDGADYFDVKLAQLRQEGRIRTVTEEDGSVRFEVMQPGKEIPYAAATPEALVEVVSSEILSTAPAWTKRSDVDAGGGASVGQNGSPTGYDPVAAGKALAEQQKNETQHADLAQAMKARYKNNPNKPAESDAPRQQKYAPAGR